VGGRLWHSERERARHTEHHKDTHMEIRMLLVCKKPTKSMHLLKQMYTICIYSVTLTLGSSMPSLRVLSTNPQIEAEPDLKSN
jgi:hypothetical protein